jgi:hypothetical protein
MISMLISAATTMIPKKIMTMMPDRSRPIWVVLCVVCLSLLSACGLTAPRSGQGYADLESLGVLDTDRVINLSIGPTLLHFAARHIDDDEEVAHMLAGLDGVRIRVYEINGDSERVAGRISVMRQHLQEDGWEPVILVREKDETVHMLVQMDGSQIVGMTVLASDGETEAVVVNLMGEIEPANFGGMMVALDLDSANIQEVRVAGGS